MKNYAKFHVRGLNQEKFFNEAVKTAEICEIHRHSKTDTTFKCSFFKRKKVEKLLKKHAISVKNVEYGGICFRLTQLLTSYGVMSAIVVFCILATISNQFVLRYEVRGLESVSNVEIIAFLKERFPKQKSKIKTKEVEIGLLDNFKELSFASCAIKGQTMVVNLKEKLLPNEIYGDFQPIYATKDAKITKINLISGTLKVKVGDIVRAGELLVEPFTMDSSGELKKVEAKAEIFGDVYSTGTSEHYENYVEVFRTGRKSVETAVLLFNLPIYSFKEEMPFVMYETEKEEVPLVKNLILPFKMQKIVFFELEKRVVVSKFEDVQDEFVEKAKQKALQNVENCDKIKDEYFTLRHQNDMTIVSYTVVTEERLT